MSGSEHSERVGSLTFRMSVDDLALYLQSIRNILSIDQHGDSRCKRMGTSILYLFCQLALFSNCDDI